MARTQSRDINKRVRLVLAADVCQRVGENQTTLGVGVVNLEGYENDDDNASEDGSSNVSELRQRESARARSEPTSIVSPFIAVTMSPGLVAFPDGKFSASGVTTTRLIGIRSWAMASAAATQAAAPPISARMSFMPVGFGEENKIRRMIQQPVVGPRTSKRTCTRLDADSARVKADTLAHKCQCRRILVCGALVVDFKNLAWLVRTRCYREVAVHPTSAGPIFVVRCHRGVGQTFESC